MRLYAHARNTPAVVVWPIIAVGHDTRSSVRRYFETRNDGTTHAVVVVRVMHGPRVEHWNRWEIRRT